MVLNVIYSIHVSWIEKKIKHTMNYEFPIPRKRKGNNVTYYILLPKDDSIPCKSQENAISTYLLSDFFLKFKININNTNRLWVIHTSYPSIPLRIKLSSLLKVNFQQNLQGKGYHNKLFIDYRKADLVQLYFLYSW